MNTTTSSITRRQMLHAAIRTSVGIASMSLVGNAIAGPPQPPDLTAMLPQLKAIHDALLAKARAMADVNLLARADGYVYTVDVAQLLAVFAEQGDESNYTSLRAHAEANLIIDDRNESYTRGFVPWRWKHREKPDASGTTEALRLARALWLGTKAFNHPTDADLTLKILDGYTRHGTIDQGIWIIRNYYNLATKCFASNSFLVDYDPDFIREVASDRKDARLAKLADDSYALVKSAVAPSGLLYDIIQPELATLYPEVNIAAFSPNDVIQFSNCCTTALTVTSGLPEIPRTVLALAMNRLTDLRAYYLGRTAEPFGDKPAKVTEFSILARVAVNLGAKDAAATIAQRAMIDWAWCAEHVDHSQAFLLTEVLQCMHALLGILKG